jgi:calcium-translocating P-type ATPase
MKIQSLSVEAALQELNSSRRGLVATEAARRLREYGPNHIEEVEHESPARCLLRQFIHFFAVLLWVAAGLAFFAEWRQPGTGMQALAWAIVCVIVINGVFSFWQEYRAERALALLRAMLPRKARVFRDGTIMFLPAVELVPGDLIQLEQGDVIPADCRLIKAFGVLVNHAALSGESMALVRDASPASEDNLLQCGNVALAGGSMAAGEASALVFATGMHTEFGMIARLTQAGREELSPLQREIIRLSRFIAVLATLLGGIFFVIGQAIGLSFWHNFIFAIGVIVANVPEGLLPTVTLALAMAAERMARRHALIRHLPAAETLGSATVICTDKTGTLTENRMSVRQVYIGDRHYLREALDGDATLEKSSPRFFETARYCHNLTATRDNGRITWAGDPLEVALMGMAERRVAVPEGQVRNDELSLDAQRMRMSVIYQTPDGSRLYCKGAPETVMPLCRFIDSGGEYKPISVHDKDRVLDQQMRMTDAGLRVLALAWRDVPEGVTRGHWEEDLVLAGLVALEDPPRPEVPAAIARCREAGIKVIMVTGDHPHTALAIAREVGLVQAPNPVIISGERLRHLSYSQLQTALDAPEVLFARVSADQKLKIVEALKRKHHIVAVTGDGVNDAPALKAAHIGIAMGRSGTEVAIEAADMVLLDDNFASIVNAIEEGRAVFNNVRKFLTYILTSNIPELVPYLAFALFRIPLPLTIIQILAVDLGTDLVPALGLGREPPDAASMQQPPRPRSERLIHVPLVLRAYLYLGVIEACGAMTAFFMVLRQAGWRYGEMPGPASPVYLQATTACLSTIIVMQIVNVFLCRSDRDSLFKTGLMGNPLILWGIVVEVLLILAIDYTPWGNALFGTAPLAPGVWLCAGAFGVLLWGMEELRKLWVRRPENRSHA